MGCDIHLYKEKKVNGVWMTADNWTTYDYGDDEKGIEVPWEQRYTDRNYDLFGLLSKGVRSEHEFSMKPRGLPFNISKEVGEDAERDGVDGHSHSFLYLHELKDLLAYLQTQTVEISGMKQKDELAKLSASIASGTPDWNLLYPYCKWASGGDYETFAIEVPASFIVGKGLEQIIASFKGVDGDNHRIVFWFDN